MKKYVFLFLLSSVVTNTLLAQFVLTNGPQTGQITDILFASKDTAYVSSYQGVFKTVDKGNTWQREILGLGNFSVNCLAKKNNNLYAGTNNGIYLSTDNALTWTLISAGIPNNGGEVYSIAFNGDTILYGGEKQVYISNNNGANWTFAGNGISNSRTVASLTVKGSKWFAAVFDSVYVSNDFGATWNSSNTGLPAGMQMYNIGIKSMGNNLVLRTVGLGSFISLNDGATWNAITDITDIYVTDLYAYNNKLYASTLAGLFESQNDGVNWSSIALNINGGSFSLAVFDSVVFSGIRAEGIYRSLNLGAAFSKQTNGLSASRSNVMMNDANDLFVGTNEGLFLTNDNGNNYYSANYGCDNPFGYFASIFAMQKFNSSLYVGTDYGIYESLNNGFNWQDIGGPLPNYTPINAITKSGPDLFAGSKNVGIYKTSNNGVNWNLLYNGAPSGCVSLFTKNSKVFATSDKTYVSPDNGANWVVLPNSPLNNYYQTITNGMHIFSANYNDVMMSKDDGLNWISISSNAPLLSGYHFISLLTIDTTYLVVGTFEGKVFLTSDKGNNWSDIGQGLPFDINIPYPIWSLGRDSTDLFVGIDANGVWRRPFTEMNIITGEEIALNKTTDFTVFPNPASNNLTVSYNATNGAVITMKIMDILGNILVNEQYTVDSNNGMLRKNISTADWSAGVYSIQLQTSEQLYLNKLVIQK